MADTPRVYAEVSAEDIAAGIQRAAGQGLLYDLARAIVATQHEADAETVWELCEEATNDYQPVAGWEPFAVADGRTFSRRRRKTA